MTPSGGTSHGSWSHGAPTSGAHSPPVKLFAISEVTPAMSIVRPRVSRPLRTGVSPSCNGTPSYVVRFAFHISEQSKSVGQSWVGSNRAIVVVTHRKRPGALHVRLNGILPPKLSSAPKSEPSAMTGRENTTCSAWLPTIMALSSGEAERMSSGVVTTMRRGRLSAKKPFAALHGRTVMTMMPITSATLHAAARAGMGIVRGVVADPHQRANSWSNWRPAVCRVRRI
mmetsp:Transcript_29773/g.88140  ORF Transcript_29773/g.88140 Transcript_29773/m.88140 type:complete len:227 (-) Transcript_29773:749-1429(-)